MCTWHCHTSIVTIALEPWHYSHGGMHVQVDELSSEAQQVIHSYTDQQAAQTGRHAALCAASGILPWKAPTAQDHATLLKVFFCSNPLIFSIVTSD